MCRVTGPPALDALGPPGRSAGDEARSSDRAQRRPAPRALPGDPRGAHLRRRGLSQGDRPAAPRNTACSSAATGCCAFCARPVCWRRSGSAAGAARGPTTGRSSRPARPDLGHRRDDGLHRSRRLGLGLRVRRSLVGRRLGQRLPAGRSVRRPGADLPRRPGALRGGRPRLARGIAVRHDWGSQYTSSHFASALRWLGLADSPAYVGEPPCNGCAERFIRTLKEQCISSRTRQTVDELAAGSPALRRCLQRRLADRAVRPLHAAGGLRPSAHGRCGMIKQARQLSRKSGPVQSDRVGRGFDSGLRTGFGRRDKDQQPRRSDLGDR